MTRLSPLVAFDAAAAGVALFGAALAFRPAIVLRRPALSAPAREAALIAGTMTMALGLAAIVFATTYHLTA